VKQISKCKEERKEKNSMKIGRYQIVVSILLIALVTLSSALYLMPLAFATTIPFMEQQIGYVWIKGVGCRPVYKIKCNESMDAKQVSLGIVEHVTVIPRVAGLANYTFYDVSVPVGWTYTTDGMTYLNITISPPITTEGTYGPVSWESVINANPNIQGYNWRTYDAQWKLLESGTLIPLIPPLPTPPVASFTWTPSTPKVQQPIIFSPTSCLPGWNGTDIMPIAQYFWNFGDNGLITTTSPQNVTHTYTRVGEYNVTLTVTAPGATPETDTTWQIVEVAGVPAPVGGISFSISVDKFGSLTPYIGLTSTILLVAVATSICVKRAKRRKEKQ
jgi:PKD repeat protein